MKSRARQKRKLAEGLKGDVCIYGALRQTAAVNHPSPCDLSSNF